MLFGAGLSLLLILQCIGNVSGGRWPISTAVVSGVLGVVLVWIIALTARRRTSAQGEFRKFILIFLASVAFFWILLAILDAFHIPWRQYWR